VHIIFIKAISKGKTEKEEEKKLMRDELLASPKKTNMNYEAQAQVCLITEFDMKAASPMGIKMRLTKRNMVCSHLSYE
jgi:hypothetical protein